jgi:hypothetical protein
MIIIRVLFCSSFEVVFLLKKERKSSLLCSAADRCSCAGDREMPRDHARLGGLDHRITSH